MKKIYDSYISDEFEGWNGESIYQLRGQHRKRKK